MSNYQEVVIDAYGKSDPNYGSKFAQFERSVGASEFKWLKIQEDYNNVWSVERNNYTFRHSNASTDDVLSKAYILIEGKITNRIGGPLVPDEDGVPDIPLENQNFGLISDTVVRNLSLSVSGTNINGVGAGKDKMFKWVHINKLTSYDKTYADAVKSLQFFYPDSESAYGTDIKKYSMIGNVGSVDNTGSNTVGFIELGIAPTIATDVDLLASPEVEAGDEGNDNGFLRFSENDKYNEGHAKRRLLTYNNQSVSFLVPLIHYIPALTAFKDGIRNYTLELTVLTNNGPIVYLANDLAYDLKFSITNMEFYLPQYKPDPQRDLFILQRNMKGSSEVRHYVDIEFEESGIISGLISDVSPSVKITSLRRNPVAIIACFQNILDETAPDGHIHRYFKPEVIQSAYIDIGGVQKVPPVDTQNALVWYSEFLKVFDVDMNNPKTLMTYDRFKNNNFMLCFDLRESKLPDITTTNANTITFNANIRLPANLPDNTNPMVLNKNTTLRNPSTNPSLKDFKINFFVFQERKLELIYSQGGLSIRNDVL